MKRTNQIIWGIILVAAGIIIALNAFGIADVELFFDGWWTLFIIIPSATGLLSDHEKTGSIIGLCIGVFLLLCCQDILDFDMLWKLVFPAIIILFGVKMIFGSKFEKMSEKAMKQMQGNEKDVRYGTAIFSGDNLDFSGEEFKGAELNAVFGGVKCNLRNAIIEQDSVIQASAIFGGIDVFVPDNVNIQVSSNSVFGGVSNKTGHYHNDSAPTIYIKCTCLFGGVDIK